MTNDQERKNVATSREDEGPTPHGGVKVRLIFLDDDDNNVDESVATRVELVELDAGGQQVWRTYGGWHVGKQPGE